MKVVISDVPRRIVVKKVRTEGILAYDTDNAYPQRMQRMVGASGTATNCVKLYSKFVKGNGLVDTVLGDTIIDSGHTINELLGLATDDFAMFGGFAVHVNYNMAFEPITRKIIPFEHTRITIPDGDGHGVDCISVYHDWAKEHDSRIKKKQIKKINLYNPDPAIIAQQIELAGGINQYNGQIFWYSNKGDAYPLPVYDSVIEDIDTDAQIKIYRNSNVRTGFSASHLFIHKGLFESSEKREEFNDKIAEFQGADVAGSMMVIEVERDEQIPEIKPVESQMDARVIKITNSSTKDNIIEAFSIPSVLVNADSNEGVTFSNDLLKLSYDYYNSIIETERTTIEAQFAKIFEDVNGNFDITPLEWKISATVV